MKKHGFSMIELVVSLMLLGIIYLNVAGLFKTNLHQDQVFYGTFADTWNQYNTVIDALYNSIILIPCIRKSAIEYLVLMKISFE